MPKTPQTIPQQLAQAALKIARANHYFVGFDPITTALPFVCEEDWQGAYRILADRENALQARKNGHPDIKARMFKEFETAFDVLGAAYYQRFHAHLR